MVNQDEAKKLKRIRFQQRFSNFEKAYAQLEDTLKRDSEHDPIMRIALIKAFELTFELAWNAMRDKFESEQDPKEEIVFPRNSIQAAYDAKYIADMDTWTKALKNRNVAAHVYDEEFAVALEKFIRLEYAPVLKDLYEYFRGSIN
ncbi:MAG: HI0074 family nucleotidyltransferase substrate-binding subunit [Patescibacteria group bacterium]|nr:HI0074 family nucleotidyltransferase substrate-binding subunit [Patescibacteria group bacterium]